MNVPMTLYSKLKSKTLALMGKSWFVLLWLPFVWAMMGFARLAVLMVQFKNLSLLFGSHDGISPAVPLIDECQLRRANEIRRVIHLAARYTPWVSNCFPKAIVARLLLGIYRVPYTLCFGLLRDEHTQNLKAHAWVVSGVCCVSGGQSFMVYTVVGCFGAQSWKKLQIK